MPTINRPRTDLKRLEALEAAKNKADVTAPGSLAFSAPTLARLVIFLPLFRNELQQAGTALSAQSGATALAEHQKSRMRTFISHFFQVFNLGILREVYTASQRAFFSLDINHDDLPRLVTEQEIGTWGQRIITGDAARVTAGGAAMSNPSAADVAAEYAAYIAAQGDQSTKKDAYDNEQEAVNSLRDDADDLISDIWDEVEFTFRKESPASKRRKAREYGVVYMPRKGETPSPDDFSIMGKVIDTDTGLALNDVAVLVSGTDIIVLTDEQGEYLIPVLPAGTYTVTGYKPGYQVKQMPNTTVTEGEITSLDIAMQANPATGTVSGTVKQLGAGAPGKVSVDGTTLTVDTDGAGNYSISNVPEGSQSITAKLNATGTKQTQTVSVTAGATTTVDFNF